MCDRQVDLSQPLWPSLEAYRHLKESMATTTSVSSQMQDVREKF